MDCSTAIRLLFISCQFALTTSTSAPQLTVVGGLSPVYSCPGELVTLSCTWNPQEVLLRGWVVNGTQHTLEELEALDGHTALTANGQVNVTIISSHTSTTTYRCSATLHRPGDDSGSLRSDPTTVICDHYSVLNTTVTRNDDSLFVSVQVQHRGCTDPIDTVIVYINSTVRQSCTRMVDSNSRDLDLCEFKGLSSTEWYEVTTITQQNGGGYQQQDNSLPDIEDTPKAMGTTWIIVGAVIGAVMLLIVLVVVALSGGVLFIRCAKHKPKDSPASDKPSSDQMYSVPDVTLEPSPAYATVEGTTSQGKSLYMNV